MRQIGRHSALGMMALAAGIAVADGGAAWRAAWADGDCRHRRPCRCHKYPRRVGHLAGGHVSQRAAAGCLCKSNSHPVPLIHPTGRGTGSESESWSAAGRTSAPRSPSARQEGAFLSIDPSGPGVLIVPPDFATSGVQASTLGGAVQMFSANSPHWLNGVNNPGAITAQYTGVSNPLGLSNNNAFGRIWPANAPFGDSGVGSSSILDPTGLPLAGAAKHADRRGLCGQPDEPQRRGAPQQPQVIPGSLSAGAVGTALLGPSPDGTCKAVFAVVTADGAIVQEHTLKGLDGLAPAGTVRPLLGRSWDDSPNAGSRASVRGDHEPVHAGTGAYGSCLSVSHSTTRSRSSTSSPSEPPPTKSLVWVRSVASARLR